MSAVSGGRIPDWEEETPPLRYENPYIDMDQIGTTVIHGAKFWRRSQTRIERRKRQAGNRQSRKSRSKNRGRK